MDDLHVRITGLRELDRGFEEFVRQLRDEMRPGFVPLARYRGEGGAPFTVERVDLVARRLGFTIRGSGF